MFDVFYIGENKKLKELVPFAKQVEDIDDINTKTKMYWLIEPNIELIDYDVLNYRPPEYDQLYEHVWKWDNSNYGGVKLLPKNESQGVKQVNKIICKKSFDILNTKTPGKYFQKYPYATHVWCVDPEYKINDRIDWAPDNFEPDFIHSFHLRDQLEHKYPEEEGGIKLYPRNWKTCDIKYHGFLDAAKSYPILYVNNIDDYSQRDVFDDEYVWMIDSEHQINESTLDWVPNPFEQSFVHVFRMPYQLTEKYPMAMGGIRLVPKMWKNAQHKIQRSCPIEDPQYDVFYIDEDEFNAETFSEYATRSKTEWFWMVDKDFSINGKLLYVPSKDEQEYIHVFKIPGHLEYRYHKTVEDAWDSRCGGIKLVHKNFDITKQKYQKDIVPVRYDIFFTDDIRNYEKFARKSRTKMFWLIDNRHRISKDINFVPYSDEQHYILNFFVEGQLLHLYTEKEGGVQLVPKKVNENTQVKYKGKLAIKNTEYPVLYVDNVDDYSVVTEDCWLVDKQYKIEPIFDWSPSIYQDNCVHTFHVKDQLRHKYPESMGGIRWVPLNRSGDTVIHEDIDVPCRKYPTILTTDVTDLTQITENIDGVWLIDSEYQIEISTINWAPPDFEEDVIHTFHIGEQLKHKYPEEMGGVRWIPANWNGGYKINKELPVAKKKYKIFFVDDPNDYSSVTEDCWLVDKEYIIDDQFDWVPDDFEKEFIHTFHVGTQLFHKYPEAMGGVHWVPSKWQDAGVKIHTDSPFKVAKYPVIFKENVDDLSDIKQHQDTWIADYEYQIVDKIDWVPPDHQREYMHVFHVKHQLHHKFPDAMGGLRWVPANWNGKYVIHDTPLDVGKRYPVFFVDDPSIPPSEVEECWLIDKDYMINESTISWCPTVFNRDKVHVFKIQNQLETKYPEEMGGVYWYPFDKSCKDYEIHTDSLQVDTIGYPVNYVEDPTDFENYTGPCWLIDSEYMIDEDISKIIPWQNPSEKDMIHVFHAADQLLHKYPEEMGGIYWLPEKVAGAQYKIHNDTPFQQVSFSVIFTEDVYVFDYNTIEKSIWVADAEYDMPDYLSWTPPYFQRSFMHVFQIKGQLEHKYPEDMGGLRWVPYDWNGEVVIHEEPMIVNSTYPIYFVENPRDYSKVTEDCWLIDMEYAVSDLINWTPSYFEKNSVHTFHVQGQLEHKYPEAMGGIHWVPKHWNGEYVIHREPLDIGAKNYPVYFVRNPKRPPTIDHECWVVDYDYMISDSISWTPSPFDRDKIHAFHVKDQLTTKYPESMGGVYWYPKDKSVTDIVIHDIPLENEIKVKKFPVLYVDDPTDFSQVKEDCWLVDKEYILDNDFRIIPWQNTAEKSMIHVYQVPMQLEHKYPEAMGGIYWVPIEWADAEIKIHTDTPFGRNIDFDVYSSEEEGREKAKDAWFWVIDPNVVVNRDFKFDYIPEVWDHGKTHIWQKLNPITGLQYDYGGIMLCPKAVKEKGRPKYIREPACTQKHFPVYHLDGTTDILKQLEEFDTKTNNTMYWVIDPFVKVTEDFDFGYYPTQWDCHNIHLFLNQDDEYRGVRLFPKGTFTEGHEYTITDIANNTFDALKEINTVASEMPEWPVYRLPSNITKDQFITELENYKNDGHSFVWTIDDDVTEISNVIDSGFVPKLENANKVHSWQVINPYTDKVHSYGGLRLWPTFTDYTDLTTDGIELNKIKALHYVREPGAAYAPYNVVFISYHEPNAEVAYEKLCEKVDNAIWIKDIDGIFEAHKAAAHQAQSKMFWVVDADADIVDDFQFDYIPDPYDQDVVHVWHSINPITGQEYGYGGVKLFNTQQVRDAVSWGLDFTVGLSKRFKEMPTVSNITRFNTDAFNTWRSAFRECVKLTLSSDDNAKSRLEAWLNPVADADFVKEAKLGATQGHEYAKQFRYKPLKLSKINDYEWLKEYYETEVLGRDS